MHTVKTNRKLLQCKYILKYAYSQNKYEAITMQIHLNICIQSKQIGNYNAKTFIYNERGEIRKHFLKQLI